MQSDALSPLNPDFPNPADMMMEVPRLASLTVLKTADKLRRTAQ
ncbi:MAG TPA: hypothetical protein VI934_02110 [Candidatus Nanoarchaeia archaeon]|nr:hypothetical protein [Candidatus Nanoarchaeia archaeon]